MTQDKTSLSAVHIEQAILFIRGQKVMLDSALARIYGVPTHRFNEAFKRNRHRFPADFAFQLTVDELANLRSHIAISSSEPAVVPMDASNSSQFAMSSHRGRRYLPWAFTEHGALMAANVLRSPRAVQMSVFVVRAFVQMRAALSGNRALAGQLAALEQALKDRLDVHDAAVVTSLQRVLDILEPSRKQIGFHVKERQTTYGAPRAAARV